MDKIKLVQEWFDMKLAIKDAEKIKNFVLRKYKDRNIQNENK
jgi:hypothetical protein